MYKAYKAESVLGLVGAIIGIVVFILGLVFGIIELATLNPVSLIASLVLLLPAFILGFIGTGALKKNKKSGGTLLLIAGILTLVDILLIFLVSTLGALNVTVWFAFITLILFLIGGIMALARKPQAPPQETPQEAPAGDAQ